MSSVIGFLGGAVACLVILAIVCRLFGLKAARACSVRLALIGLVAVAALLALIAALGGP